ncbi:MAG: outer membrane lipoprotein-sorting protein [Candidatus Omnitrophica bacterium]|nr:outer membrane lipoprotein-sorting protein [Candidatus Omnitrophota bacterium]
MHNKIMIAFAFLLVMAVSAFAQEMTAQEIVQKANLASYYAGQDGTADVAMVITDAQGRERKREMRILRYDQQDGGEQKYYVYFFEPADVSKMVFMVWKHLDKDDDRWLYLPALDLVRRIAASDKRSSFVGSHFVYEDVSGRGIEADTHTLISEDEQYYRIKNVPKDKGNVEFAYYDVWINKENFLPVKAEYFDVKDELIRLVEATDIQTIQGYPTVMTSVAKDLVRGGSTTMTFNNVQYDAGIEENIFEERYLRRPPVKWIRK